MKIYQFVISFFFFFLQATRDEEFISLENKFNENTKIATQLRAEAQAFRDSIASLLSNQAEMPSVITLIYNLDENSSDGVQPSAIQAANDAEAAMAYCRDEVLPSLDTIDHTILRPLLEIQDLIKRIQKTVTKRNHKLVDYDRHRLSLAKLQAKTERSMSEEKSVFKVQAQLETATQDYEYLNNMLKEQLPVFLSLLRALTQPIFESLYQLQTQVYGMIYARCYELIKANEGHFVTHTMSVDEGYQWRKTQFDAQAEIQNTDLLKSGGKAWLTASGGSNKLSLQERAALKQNEMYGQQQQPIYNQQQQQQPTYGQQQLPQERPSYDIQQNSYYDHPPPSYTHEQQQPQLAASAPAVPVAQPIMSPESQSVPQSEAGGLGSPSKQYVLALYDYEAQAQGDLSFKKDDKIELVQRTADTNDWWTGRLRGIVGVFPGNYVSIL
ncbi:MAG: hypothetical protein EXX96DRAFT_568562 [Benjaminiella poitrasii]|nr:MAG: hypothetical protein EXX96DRAFT_568562 [Benjaminiella poitrasii]